MSCAACLLSWSLLGAKRTGGFAMHRSAFDPKRTWVIPYRALFEPLRCLSWPSGVLMRRREFVRLLVGAAAIWPLSARAQQEATPVIGFLRPTRAEDAGHLVAAFRQ